MVVPLPQVNIEVPLQQANMVVLHPQISMEALLPQANMEAPHPQANMEAPHPQASMEVLHPQVNIVADLPQVNMEDLQQVRLEGCQVLLCLGRGAWEVPSPQPKGCILLRLPMLACPQHPDQASPKTNTKELTRVPRQECRCQKDTAKVLLQVALPLAPARFLPLLVRAITPLVVHLDQDSFLLSLDSLRSPDTQGELCQVSPSRQIIQEVNQCLHREVCSSLLGPKNWTPTRCPAQ